MEPLGAGSVSLRDVGNSVVKYWAIIVFCLAGIAFASIAYADLQAVKAKVLQADKDRDLLIQIARDVDWLKQRLK
jgi:hypothetical protein